jgi:hypothetical protein
MLWYISFATERAFLGATIVEANTIEDALDETRRLGINPGGEAAMIALSDDAKPHPMTQFMMNRLRSKMEMATFGPLVRSGDMTAEEREAFEGRATFVCNDCN